MSDALLEVRAVTTQAYYVIHASVYFSPLRKALSDPLPEVRAAAAQTFDALHNTVGTRALDEILPPLMERLSQPDQVGRGRVNSCVVG